MTSETDDKLRLINQKDLEWLAWNWRAWNNMTKHETRRAMVLYHLLHDQPFLPTPEQILHGIVLAQADQFATSQQDDYECLYSYVNVWKKLFGMMKGVDMKKPITPTMLADSKNEFVKMIVYIYSM